MEDQRIGLAPERYFLPVDICNIFDVSLVQEIIVHSVKVLPDPRCASAYDHELGLYTWTTRPKQSLTSQSWSQPWFLHPMSLTLVQRIDIHRLGENYRSSLRRPSLRKKSLWLWGLISSPIGITSRIFFRILETSIKWMGFTIPINAANYLGFPKYICAINLLRNKLLLSFFCFSATLSKLWKCSILTQGPVIAWLSHKS